ncbi:MAG: hypothetical protein AB1635_18250 [Acidobacteriota bacterium]
MPWAALRPAGARVGVGGDEFAALLVNTTEEQALGAAAATADQTDASAGLYEIADRALCRATRGGRTRVSTALKA